MATTGWTKRWLDRDTVTDEAECPKCGAQRGFECVRKRGGVRTSNHRERVELAQDRLGFTPTPYW